MRSCDTLAAPQKLGTQMLGKVTRGFMTVRFLESSGGTSETNIHELERELKKKLPSDYRNFLLRYNGGLPQPNTFSYTGRGGRRRSEGVRWLFGLNLSQFRDSYYYRGMYLDRIPTNCLAIGSVEGSNLILISFDGDDRGTVYFWDHDEEMEEGEAPTYDNLFFITKSFDEFLDSLHDESALTTF